MVKKGDRKVTKGDDHEIVDSQRLKKVFFFKIFDVLVKSCGSYAFWVPGFICANV